jgi:threonylcarbamoyladenosine tRNA methylthiotransferase MtaB
MILKRMKRRHLRDDSIRFCADIRARRPDIVLGADIIVGFPTETDAMFENSLKIVDECGLTNLHVFPFSPREGTPAAKMPQVERSVAKARAALLRATGDEAYVKHLNAMVGTRQTALIERSGNGRTEGFTLVKLGSPDHGSLVDVEITGHDGTMLTAITAPRKAA